jgi:hypothetical protein
VTVLFAGFPGPYGASTIGLPSPGLTSTQSWAHEFLDDESGRTPPARTPTADVVQRRKRSLREIAAILNAEQIPARRGRWHPETVRRALTRG